MDRNEIRQLANELDIEYSGDLYELYAHVGNHSNCGIVGEPDKTLVALKHEIEHRLTLLYMEERSWDQTDTGRWYKIEDDEFWKHYRAAMDKSKNKKYRNNTIAI